MTPAQQLVEIAQEADRLTASQQEVWRGLRKAIAAAGLEAIGNREIDKASAAWLDRHFANRSSGPDAAGDRPGPSLPLHSQQGLLADLRSEAPLGRRADPRASDGAGDLASLHPDPGEEARYIAVESLIRRHISTLFPGYEVLGHGAFRVIRDSDIEVEEEAEDLVRYFRSAIKRRRRGRVIRLELEAEIPDELEALVRTGLDASEALVVESTGFLGVADLEVLVEEDRPDLKFPPFTARFPERIRSMAAIASLPSEARTSSSTTLMKASRWSSNF
jgi:polyphosphate kinase